MLIFNLKGLGNLTHLVNLRRQTAFQLQNLLLSPSILPYWACLEITEIPKGWVLIQLALGWILCHMQLSSKLSINLRDEAVEFWEGVCGKY